MKIRASIWIERGQIESAIADLREALSGQPKGPDLLLLMAVAYEKDGKPVGNADQEVGAGGSVVKGPTHDFRNTEFFAFEGDRIKRIDVYFGATYENGVFVKQHPPTSS